MVAFGVALSSLLSVAAGCASIAAALVVLVMGRSGVMSVRGIFSLTWFVFFPVRLISISVDRDSVRYYQSVRGASHRDLIWIWLLTTAAFVAFVVGAVLIERWRPPVPRVDEEAFSYSDFLALCIIGTFLYAALDLGGIASGILGTVATISLFGIAGASYCEIKRLTTHRYLSAIFVVINSGLGYRAGFKEALLLPIAAWIVGRFVGGQRLRARYVVLAVLTVCIGFAAIQGLRVGRVASESDTNPISATLRGLTKYSLTDGERHSYQGVEIVGNVANGILFRLKGVDYLMEIMDAVPDRVSYQYGRSLWQPALSVVPGSSDLFSLDPDYRQLSLGRFVTTRLIFESSQTDNRSSQSMTFPGDLYLNFGSVGIILGMGLLGVAFGAFDVLFRVSGPMTTGILVMAGLPLVAVERNLAYVIVTSVIALGVIAVTVVVIPRGRALVTRGRERAARRSA